MTAFNLTISLLWKGLIWITPRSEWMFIISKCRISFILLNNKSSYLHINFMLLTFFYRSSCSLIEISINVWINDSNKLAWINTETLNTAQVTRIQLIEMTLLQFTWDVVWEYIFWVNFRYFTPTSTRFTHDSNNPRSLADKICCWYLDVCGKVHVCSHLHNSRILARRIKTGDSSRDPFFKCIFNAR